MKPSRPSTCVSAVLLACISLEALFTTASAPELLGKERTAANVGLLFALPAIGGVGGIIYTAYRAKSGRLALRSAAILFACGLLVMSGGRDWQVLVLGRILAAFSGAIVVSTIYTLVAVDDHAGRRGALVSTIGLAISAPALALPLLAVLASSGHPSLVFAGIALLVLAVLPAVPSRVLIAGALTPLGVGRWVWLALSVAGVMLWASGAMPETFGYSLLLLAVVGSVPYALSRRAQDAWSPDRQRIILCARALGVALFFGVDILLPFVIVDRLSLGAGFGGATVMVSALGWAICSIGFPLIQRRGQVLIAAQVGSLVLVLAVICSGVVIATVSSPVLAVVLLSLSWLFAGAGAGALSCASTELAVVAQSRPNARLGPELPLIDAISISVGTGVAGLLLARLSPQTAIAILAAIAILGFAAFSLRVMPRTFDRAAGPAKIKRVAG